MKKPDNRAEASTTATVRQLADHGLARVTLTTSWHDGRADHENHLHIDRFSVFRETNSLPEEIAGAVTGMREGDRISATNPDIHGLEAWSESLVKRAKPGQFDTRHRRGLVVEPRLGRYYPQGFFHRIPDIFEDAVLPARVVELTPDRMTVDLNHPLARYPLQVQLQVDEILPEYDRRGGRCLDPMLDLVQFTGLAAPLADGNLTDFGDDKSAKKRMDESDDAIFYNGPRMVQHLDAQALSLINALYRRLLPRDAVALDLMASFDSHLQGTNIAELHLLGMNREELAANGAATESIVQNLNQQAALPYSNDSLDAVVATASIEYLIHPEQVLLDVKRVLRPGGLFIVSFSNRWFPTKAIHVWRDLHEFERVGMVTQWLQQAGFYKLSTYSAKGWPRPSDDRHVIKTPFCDPVYAVWGYKP